MSGNYLPKEVWQENTLQNDQPANNNSLRDEAVLRPCLGIENSPPTSNSGDVYIVGDTPAGAFAAFAEDDVALHRGGTWYAWTPFEGMRLVVEDTRMVWTVADGWDADPSIGGISDGNKGDITVSSSGAAWNINDEAVTYAKIQDVSATKRVLGRNTAGAGSVEEVTASQFLDWLGSAANGDIVYRTGGAWALLPVGTNGHVLTLAAGLPVWQAGGGGGGGSPGGSDTQVQFNSSGSFGADSTFTFNATTKALSSPLMWFGKGTDIARAATTSIAGATGNFVHLTGTTTITSFGSGTAGQTVHIRFAGAGTLTHNGTSLILPGGANITTAANDCCTAVCEGSSNWRVTSYTRASGQSVVLPTISITGWTQSLATASPNGATNVSRLLASGGTTNQHACIQPKGNGGFMLNQPDGTATGGNTRGIYTFDGQGVRANANEVASGDYSVLFGAYSRAGATGAVAIGYGNAVIDQYGSAIGGTSNSASYCAFATGISCVASGQYSHASGRVTLADGENSWAGGYGSAARGTYGAQTWASGYFAAQGDCQDRNLHLRIATTNATQTPATTNGGVASTTNQIVLPDNSDFVVKATVVARRNSNGDSKSWDVTAHVKRGANAAATAMVAAATVTQIAAAAGASGWALDVDADTTNGGMRFRVTGAASADIRWGIHVYSCNEVVG